jgi:hypothetical protein
MKAFRPYKLGVEPSPSVPCEALLQDGWDAFLLFEAFGSTSKMVIIECEGCASTRFGYPNDEGLPEHPHYNDGISASDSAVLFSEDTPWLTDVLNQMAGSSQRIWGGRGMGASNKPTQHFHFIVTLKEATFECIAEGLKVAHTVSSLEEAFSYVRERFSKH